MTEIAQMLECLRHIEARMERIETMLVALIAEDFEQPTPAKLAQLQAAAQRRFQLAKNRGNP